MNYRNPALTKLARGRDCTIRRPGYCNGDPATSVWAHSNFQIHGKGKSLKAHDIFGCIACSGCHHWLDNVPAPREEKLEAFRRANDESLLILFMDGALVVAGTRQRAPRQQQPISKIVPRGERVV
ncbi:nuclease domain-containing protein [Algiphilus aromaticivorans]|uniref:nuclease domain-containing protein n=1 Tax=Algiphilus aromaticivorans TaxID=382454 RepID=UPI000693E2CF|nr:nuclease domain-containing protein [Algiphilus aromaticivorans]